MHVWSQDFTRYPVSPPEPGLRPITDEGSTEFYLQEMKQHGIDLAVLVQPRQYGWDNRYIADSVRRFPQRFVGHGLIDPHDPNNAGVLERGQAHSIARNRLPLPYTMASPATKMTRMTDKEIR